MAQAEAQPAPEAAQGALLVGEARKDVVLVVLPVLQILFKERVDRPEHGAGVCVKGHSVRQGTPEGCAACFVRLRIDTALICPLVCFKSD